MTSLLLCTIYVFTHCALASFFDMIIITSADFAAAAAATAAAAAAADAVVSVAAAAAAATATVAAASAFADFGSY